MLTIWFLPPNYVRTVLFPTQYCNFLNLKVHFPKQLIFKTSRTYCNLDGRKVLIQLGGSFLRWGSYIIIIFDRVSSYPGKTNFISQANMFKRQSLKLNSQAHLTKWFSWLWTFEVTWFFWHQLYYRLFIWQKLQMKMSLMLKCQ